jgi:hypothetical protein
MNEAGENLGGAIKAIKVISANEFTIHLTIALSKRE